MASFGYKPSSMRDVPEQSNPMDEWARSEERSGWVSGTNPAHQSQIEMITRAVQAGQISKEGVENLSKRVKGLAPYLNSALASRETDLSNQNDVSGIVGKYISPGTGGDGDYETPPTDPREDPKGLIRELANNPAYLPVAKEYSQLYGIDKEHAAQGRGEYYTPVYDKDGRLLSFNSRSGQVEQPTLPVVGAKFSPSLQGSLAGASAHGSAVGKDLAGSGNLADSGTSVRNAMAMLDKGIYTGTYAETSKMLAKGIPGMDKEKAANTEQFISHIGNVVIPMMKDLGGSDTVEELNYMKQLVAGNISMEPQAIKNVLAATERKIIAKQRRMKAQAGSVGLGGKAETVLPESGVNTAPTVTQGGVLTDQQREALRKRHGL